MTDFPAFGEMLDGVKLQDIVAHIWHKDHTFTCFAYPTFTEEDMTQIAAALVRVIKAYSA